MGSGCRVRNFADYLSLNDMAPTRTVRNKSSLAKGSTGEKGLKASKGTKNKISKKNKAPPPRQQKTKSASGPVKKNRRVYTDEELGITKLNMITPVGVELPKGKKKGKIFVDDQVCWWPPIGGYPLIYVSSLQTFNY